MILLDFLAKKANKHLALVNKMQDMCIGIDMTMNQMPSASFVKLIIELLDL